MYYIKNIKGEIIEITSCEETASRYLFFLDSIENPHYLEKE